MAKIGDGNIVIIDTAGLEEAEPDSVTAKMRAQSEMAVAGADLVLFVIDARAGVVPGDEYFAEIVRQSGRPVLLLANKCEGRQGMDGAYDGFRLGLGDPVAISAEHGDGMGDLFRELLLRAEAAQPGEGDNSEPDSEDGDRRALKVAIVGRPNAGKSTLVNALLGEDRVITGPEAGITRDTISVATTWGDREIRLFDTAGMRRKSRVREHLEQLSVGNALEAIRFAEVVVLLLDAERPFDKQDLAITDLIAREGRALVLAVNKWDLVSDKQARLAHLRSEADRLLPQIRGVALVTLSALGRQGLGRLRKAVLDTEQIWNRRLGTGALNRFLCEATDAHTPPAVSGRRVRLRYMTQPNARPPTFIVFTTRPDAVPESYTRYLVNALRETFGLSGVPIRLHLRKGKNPYAGR